MKDENLENVIFLILGIIIVLVTVLVIFAGISLIVWGIGNAIIYLFALSMTWTYLQACITVFALWGIKKILQWICG